jgi:hypothetical protein
MIVMIRTHNVEPQLAFDMIGSLVRRLTGTIRSYERDQPVKSN